jgi:hypothetical protein
MQDWDVPPSEGKAAATWGKRRSLGMTGTTPIDTIIQGDCLEEMGKLPDKSIDAIVTDPPAGINFMQKSWDGDKGGRNQWIAWMKDIAGECLRVIKPGGHALVWALPRTSHWTGMAWEEAGWEPRDKISHVFGSGFPKSLDIGKAIDRSIFTTKTSNPDFQIVRAWVRGKVKAAGLTYKQIDTALGNANSHKASHYLDNSQPQLPTPEDWEIIKNMLHLDESVDINRPPKLLVETFEREIIGYRKCHAGLAFTSEGPTELPITKPMSKEAEQWAGWGSSLKPAHEDWWLFRAPLDGCTIAENVLRWGCGGLNVDGCRINPGEIVPGGGRSYGACDGVNEGWKRPSHADYESKPPHTAGRFPSNLIHDNSPEVLAEFAKAGERKTGHRSPTTGRENNGTFNACKETLNEFQGSFGSASRFFMACEFTPADYAPIVYYAKASRSEREAGLDGMPDAVMPFNEIGFDETKRGRQPQENKAKNHHPTVKPLELIKYLSKLICPPGGLILDPFGGSGTTGIAAIKEGFHYILIEKEPEYCEIARKRVAAVPARLDRWAEADA